MSEEIVYKPIGVIHTSYARKEDTPIQGCFSPDNQGYIEVFPEYAEGLKDIAGFSHLILLYHFDIKEKVKDGWYPNASERSKYRLFLASSG